MAISFIFVNYNNSHDTYHAVVSIYKFIKYVNRIIVVDNGSKEDSTDELRKMEAKFDKLIVVYNPTNVGYFKGINIALKILTNNEKKDMVIIGNNDLIFSKKFPAEVGSIDENVKGYPVISPDIITSEGVHQNPHVIRSISRVREFFFDVYYFNYYLAIAIFKVAKITNKFTSRKDEREFETAQEIYQGYGACYILTPSFFDNFDSLYSPTFLMYEEFFLSKQLSDKKLKIYYEPSIHVTHKRNGSIGAVPKKEIWEISRESHKEYRKYV